MNCTFILLNREFVSVVTDKMHPREQCASRITLVKLIYYFLRAVKIVASRSATLIDPAFAFVTFV